MYVITAPDASLCEDWYCNIFIVSLKTINDKEEV